MSLWPIYIISLPGETARRAVCKAAMEAWGLPFTFFDAVEGARLSEAEITSVYDPDKNKKLFKRPLSAPEIGCYLSHHTLWKRIGEDHYPGAVVLEDDFDADDALATLLREISRLELRNRLVKLHSEKRVSGKPVADLADGYQLIEPRNVPGQTLGYVVSREAAANLAEKALPFGRPVDMDLKHFWEFDISILMVQPPVLHIPEAPAKSSIESARQAAKPHGELGTVVRLVRNLRYQLPYRVGFFKARLKSRARARARAIDPKLIETPAMSASPSDTGARRNLVVVRAGRNSLHPQWLDAGSQRNWDLVVSLYDPDARFYHDADIAVVEKRGGKWDGLHALFAQSDLLDRYDYVWLPDDDIAACSSDIDAIFDAMRQYDLDVAQPSLTRDSYFSHFALMSCPGFALRYTNFVEIMVPCLKVELAASSAGGFQGFDERFRHGLHLVPPVRGHALQGGDRRSDRRAPHPADRPGAARPDGQAGNPLRRRGVGLARALQGPGPHQAADLRRARPARALSPRLWAARTGDGRPLSHGLSAIHGAGERELEDFAIGPATGDAEAGFVKVEKRWSGRCERGLGDARTAKHRLHINLSLPHFVRTLARGSQNRNYVHPAIVTDASGAQPPFCLRIQYMSLFRLQTLVMPNMSFGAPEDMYARFFWTIASMFSVEESY